MPDNDLNKVALVINSLSGGGAEKNVLKVAEQFMQRGVEVYLICLKEKERYPVPPGLNYICLSKKRRLKTFKSLYRHLLARRLRSTILRFEVDASDLIISWRLKPI